MDIDEELLVDQHFQRLNLKTQSEIIAARCGGVQTLIKNAYSRVEAVKIADRACRRFADECQSEILRRALMERVQQMVEKYWGK